jgi:hypothetical protein
MIRNTHVRDNPMKRALCVAKPVLSGREFAKVLCRARDNVVEQAEHDSASRFRVDRHVELQFFDTTKYVRKIIAG